MNKDQEIRILVQLLDKLKIYDIQLSYDESGILLARDEDGNSWAGKEFYRFLTEECLCFDKDGNLAWGQFVPAEVLEPYKELSKQNGVIPGQPESAYPLYLDRNGNAIKPGMKILMADGGVELVYETTDEFGNPDLGISATNRAFLDRHPDWAQEFYSLSSVGIGSAEICLSEPEIRKELEEIEAFIQGTEMAIDYGQQLPEGDYRRYEKAIARRTQLTAMLNHNDKPETDQKNDQKTVPKERGDSR